MNKTTNAPLAVTIGEPAGIGPDLVLQLFARRKELELPAFIAYGNADFLKARARRLGLDISVSATSPAQANGKFRRSLPVLETGGKVADVPASPARGGAQMAMQAIARATGDCLTGACRALVTAPINKAALQRIGFKHPGHTEFLAHLCAGGGEEPVPVMMLVHGDLRVVPLTIHVPLSRVPGLVNTQAIVRKTRIVARDLENRFGLKAPRIALTGLNPHAGEEGTMGHEDENEILPAVALLRKEGIDVHGPFPADTAFYPPNWRNHDVVIAMYHDQALIPIKTLAFDEAVNVTLGLPLIRMSPDHGTAFDLAGNGKASVQSMLEALRLADRLSSPHPRSSP